MSPEIIVDLMRQGIMVLLILVSALILPSLIVGVLISIFQAATQINEQSLSFIPRLMVTFITIMLLSPWLIQVITDFTNEVFEAIPGVIS